MAILQDNNSDIHAYHTAITGFRLQDILYWVPTQLFDVFMHSLLLIIAKLLYCLVFETIHNFAHPGVKPMQMFITQRFVWHGIKKDVTFWVRSCTACQFAKVHHHTIAPLHKFTLTKTTLTASMSLLWVLFLSQVATLTFYYYRQVHSLT